MAVVIHVSIGPSSTEPRSNLADDQPHTCPFSCQIHPYQKWFDHEARLSMFCLCADSILVVYAQFVLWRNDIILDKPVQSMTSLPTCALAANEPCRREIKKCDDQYEPENNSFTPSSFVVECCSSLYDNKMQTQLMLLWSCLVHSMRDTMRIVFACLEGWLSLPKCQAASLLRFLAALTVFITWFNYCLKVSNLYCFATLMLNARMNARHHEKITGNYSKSIPIFSPCKRQDLLQKHNMRSWVPVAPINLEVYLAEL